MKWIIISKNILLIYIFKKKKKTENEKYIWFKWIRYSCRYDFFSFLYSFIIYHQIENLKRTLNIDIIKYFQMLSKKDFKLVNEIYNRGIWEFFKNNTNKHYDLTTEILDFKRIWSISSILDMLRFKHIFCIKYI